MLVTMTYRFCAEPDQSAFKDDEVLAIIPSQDSQFFKRIEEQPLNPWGTQVWACWNVKIPRAFNTPPRCLSALKGLPAPMKHDPTNVESRGRQIRVVGVVTITMWSWTLHKVYQLLSNSWCLMYCTQFVATLRCVVIMTTSVFEKYQGKTLSC